MVNPLDRFKGKVRRGDIVLFSNQSGQSLYGKVTSSGPSRIKVFPLGRKRNSILPTLDTELYEVKVYITKEALEALENLETEETDEEEPAAA